MYLQNVRVLGPTGLSLPTGVTINAAGAADRDASGLILSPGWLDLHAHLRDPGFPQKETLQTGATSAAFGGFTHIVAMANTDPVTDRPELLRALVARAAALPIRVSFVAAVTMGLEGRTLTDAAALQRAGAVALSDDGRHLMSQVILRRALTAAAEAGLPVVMGLGLDDRVLYRACVERPREIIGQAIDDEWILIDPLVEWTVDGSSFKSRGKNTPFSGRRLRGRIVMTLSHGQVVMERVMQHA